MMDYKMSFLNILILAAVLGSVTSSPEVHKDCVSSHDEKNEIDHSSYRLPNEVIPILYDVWIYTRLNIPDFTYKGRVNMIINVLNATNKIIVHTEGLIIEKNKTSVQRVLDDSLESVPVEKQYYDTDKQFFIIELKKLLNPESYTVILNFEGNVRDDVFGFYRSSYIDNDETKWIGATQFSPTFARRAFPCMDEPHLKAGFTFHIGHSKNQNATSNCNIQHTIEDPNDSDYRITTFCTTPLMSTYLVGWVVHDFVPSTTYAKNFNMWTRNSMRENTFISLSKGEEIYDALLHWFQVENPIAKMDQFALPDFNFYAMENWGLITYRESVVLYEDGVTPTRKIMSGLMTMSHEYAHTWFGNIVTPMFWDVVWLKEGFATYFQYHGRSMADPLSNAVDKFTVEAVQPTLLEDSANHERTMNGKNVGSPSSIMATLDFVSYKKGASIITMLAHVIGPTFRIGLQNYLKNMSTKAAEPSDLYRHLQDVVNEFYPLQHNVPIETFVESWANQPGYPLITVTRNYTSQTVVLSQERFYQNRSQWTPELNASKWWIPLNFASSSNPQDFFDTSARNWLRPQDKNLIIDSFPSQDWVIFNIQQSGYYRVNYDENNWRMLIENLRSKDIEEIHKLNRASLLDDAFNLARSGYIDYSIPFNLSTYLIRETEYEPWVAATNNFKFLNQMLSSVPDVHRLFQEYARRLLEPMYRELSFSEFPNELSTTKMHRELILSISCSFGNTQCMNTSKTLFGSWISSPDKRLLQDVKSFVYCLGIRDGNESIWHTTWERFLNTDLQTEQELLLQGLGCTKDPDLINKYLNSSISLEQGIRKQYRMLIIDAVLDGNPNNVDYTLKFMKNNLQRIIHAAGHNFVTKMFKAIGKKVTTEKQTNMLRSIAKENKKVLGTTLDAAKEAVISSMSNVKWIQTYSPLIANYLS